MSRLNVELQEGLHKRFRGQVQEDGRKESDVIRVLILDWVETRVREKHALKKIERGDNERETD